MLRSALLEAILTEQQVQSTYKNTSDTKIDEKQVSPLGITLGPRVYLVALDQSIKEIRNYALTESYFQSFGSANRTLPF